MSFYLPQTNAYKAPLAHVTVGVTDMVKSRAFYDATFAALGWKVVFDYQHEGKDVFVGYGPELLAFGINLNGEVRAPGFGTHVAFEAPSEQAVKDWHEAAVANGGTDDGKPGLRKHYSPNYFAAFVQDPDGHRIETVCRLPKD